MHTLTENRFKSISIGLGIFTLLFSIVPARAATLDQLRRLSPNTTITDASLLEQTHYGMPDRATQLQLIDCFNSGKCHDTGDSTWRRYPARCNGSGEQDCSGCYQLSGNGKLAKVNDLTKSGNCAAGSVSGGNTSTILSSPQIRVWLSYQMICPNKTGTGPADCTDGELRLNCKIADLDTGSYATDAVSGYDRDCFPNGGFIRRAASYDKPQLKINKTVLCGNMAKNYCANQFFYDSNGNGCYGDTKNNPSTRPDLCGNN